MNRTKTLEAIANALNLKEGSAGYDALRAVSDANLIILAVELGIEVRP